MRNLTKENTEEVALKEIEITPSTPDLTDSPTTSRPALVSQKKIAKHFTLFVNQQYQYGLFLNNIFEISKKKSFFKTANVSEKGNAIFLNLCMQSMLLTYHHEARYEEFSIFAMMSLNYLSRLTLTSTKEALTTWLSQHENLSGNAELYRIVAIAALNSLYNNILEKHSKKCAERDPENKDKPIRLFEKYPILFKKLSKEVQFTERYINKLYANEDTNCISDEGNALEDELKIMPKV